MSIEQRTTVGYGLHVSSEALNSWAEKEYPDEASADAVDIFLSEKGYSLITAADGGDTWAGEDDGVVLFASRTAVEVEQRRGGIFPVNTVLTAEEITQLDRAYSTIVGQDSPREFRIYVATLIF